MARAWEIVAVAALITTAGCATITTGTSQEVSLVTDPAGASCQVKRSDVVLATVSSTPGRVTVSKSPLALTIKCEKAGYEPASGFLLPTLQGMTHGNVLLGGLIGMAVDVQSGAINRYPSSISLTLVPTQFERAEARDAFFANLAKVTREQAESEIISIRNQSEACKPTPHQKQCVDAIKMRENQRDAELEQIEQRRRRARVVRY